MLILTIRSDKPEAEVGLYNDQTQLAYETWQAHRELSDTILLKIEALLKSKKKTWHDLEGVACFKGPGSFTGLRIGLTVGNSLANELNIPIVSTSSEEWQKEAVNKLINRQNEKLVMPEYGRAPHITKPKK